MDKSVDMGRKLLGLIDGFFDTATRADEGSAGRVAPAGEGHCVQARLFGLGLSFVKESGPSFARAAAATVARLRLGAAMFADPAEARIDEMIRLDHKKTGSQMPDVSCW